MRSHYQASRASAAPRRESEAALSSQGPIQAMWRMFVAPGVPKGTPAVITRRWPGLRETGLDGALAGDIDHFREILDIR